MKSLIKLWNKNFDAGVSTFQIFLMVMMFIGAYIESNTLILFCMFNVLFGYLEPNQHRFSLKRRKKR